MSRLDALPSVLLQHISAWLPLPTALAGLRSSCRRFAHADALPTRTLLRGRMITINEASLKCAVPVNRRSDVSSMRMEAAAGEAQLKADDAVGGVARMLAQFSGLTDVELQHVCAGAHAIAMDADFVPVWTQLRSLRLLGPHALPLAQAAGSERWPSLHLESTLLHRLLPLHASTLRVLDVRLQSSSGGLRASQRERQQRDDERLLSGLVCAMRDAGLGGLQSLRLEYAEECELETSEDDAHAVFNFSRYSGGAAAVMRQLLQSLPSLTTLHTTWFHADVLLPFVNGSVTQLHFSGLLTFRSLASLARCSGVQTLLLDFIVNDDELRREWIGEPLDSSVEAIRTSDEEAAAMASAAASVAPTHAAPTPVSSPDATSSAGVDVSYFVFHALARLTQLRSLQLQSTLQDRNCCRVDWRNFTLLPHLSQLIRLQFSCFLPPHGNSSDLSSELDRLCVVLPQLQDVIVNIERREDGAEEADQEVDSARITPANLQGELCAASLPSRQPIAAFPQRVRRLKKLGVWDGHAAEIGSSSDATAAPCILHALSPFLLSNPQLHSLSLIFCHLSTWQPLRHIAHSLVSLCLYVSNVPMAGAPDVVDFSALACLHNLHWLILHGTGVERSSFSVAQLVQLGSIVAALPRLRNLRVEHQPAMCMEVWQQWRTQRITWPTLYSLSFKDCTQLGLDTLLALLSEITQPTAGVSALLPQLLALDVQHTCMLDVDASQQLRAALLALRAAEAHTTRHIQVQHSLQ